MRSLAVSASGWLDPPWERAREPAKGRVLKLFVDGGWRCAMRLPRDGRETTSGFLFYSAEELTDLLVTAWRAGWRVTCHAIGNRGVELVVDAIEAALALEPKGEVRIDHAMFLTRQLVARIKALGIWVVSQPSFLYDLGVAIHPLPPDILSRPFGSLFDAGVPQAFSSDYPCGSLAPLTGIYAATTRRSRHGQEVSPEERVPVRAALEAYTIQAARAAGLAEECGSLEVGKRADLVVLDANPLEVPAEDLLRLKVIKTLVAGEEVWP